ncbi:uncharacterized protein K460DRAFT_383020 [Cucurbitaria berberidis CBS 394.84]|uniref:Glycine zipper 2TM domain-containing protein n=1 Tax=Cucurbitaria berberidis CBS 394.84 TaxID=1168544 RepID=A0A9P4LE44_9PLEO|nr:uncharacterized protein K460DRAFT_383020 [Cucurbitaria berberidis CBS 394.84]KAF1851660.1 hypothetical protein K460DRAFT_383020 [Cucurbitaria berberidis CBS 394.84]
MSVLAFKALGYGAEQIPDKFFEKIPGGFFTPQEKKDIDKGRKDRKDKSRPASEQRSSRRGSRRDRTPPTDYSDYSAYDDTDYERERERRKRDRRRAKSAGRNPSRSMSRGRHNRRNSRDFEPEHGDYRDMAQAERGEPYFPPPPSSGEYKPYNPQEYSSRPAHDDYQPSPTAPAYGYSPQPAAAQPYPTQPSVGPHDGHRASSTAARYTPGPGYAPSPPVNVVIPPQTGAANSPYVPYNPADYPASNAYPTAPPFTRQRSNSQPYTSAASNQQITPYVDQPPSRRGSTKPRREHRHRARSADTHSSHSRRDDQHRESSRMAKVRDRFDGMDLRERGLAATVGGALAGGLAGRQMGKSRLTTLAGVAAGALGGRAIVDKRSNCGFLTGYRSRGGRRSPSRSRSRSRSRPRASDRARSRDRSPPRGIRARSKSIVDRFRSKSRGPEDRDARRDRYDRDQRPDHGYDNGRVDHDYFSSDSEGDGSPAKTHRRRRRDY